MQVETLQVKLSIDPVNLWNKTSFIFIKVRILIITMSILVKFFRLCLIIFINIMMIRIIFYTL
jgi:type IV secretory pathway TrbL component